MPERGTQVANCAVRVGNQLWRRAIVTVVMLMCSAVKPAGQPLEVAAPTVLFDARRGACGAWVGPFLRECGYHVKTHSVPLSRTTLAEVDVVVLNVGMSATRYTADEVAVMREFFEKGGGILIGGQAWSFVQYGKGTEADYPVNRLTAFTGIHVAEAYARKATVFEEHSVKEGVGELPWGKGLSSSLKLERPAEPLARDAKGRVVMAVADAEGKAIHIGHEWLHESTRRGDRNVETFLRNVMHWLAPVAPLTDDSIRSQLAKRGTLAWAVPDPEDANTVWASLDGTLLQVNRFGGELTAFSQVFGERLSATAIAFADRLVWVGTKRGLVTRDPVRRTWTRHATNGDYEMLHAEVVSLELCGEPRQLVVRVKTGSESPRFTYDLTKRRWIKALNREP